jgi:hypothetical protein
LTAITPASAASWTSSAGDPARIFSITRASMEDFRPPREPVGAQAAGRKSWDSFFD